MTTKTKFVLWFISLSIFSITLITTVGYYSYLNVKLGIERNHFEATATNTANIISALEPDVPATTEFYAKLANSLTQQYSLVVQDNSGRLIYSSDQGRSAEKRVINTFLTRETTGTNADYLVDDSKFILWKQIFITPSEQVFLVYGSQQDAIISFFNDFAKPILVTSLIILWIAFWTAIILAKLVSKNELQHKKLQKQAEQLEQARDEALFANQAKSRFLANMSHEIRTPLTTIIGFAETALHTQQATAQREDALNRIITSSKHLLHVINEILDISKIEAGKLDIEHIPSNVAQLMSDIEMIIKPQATAKNLGFEINYSYPLPHTINTDPTRVKQILLNLCSNAIKFTNFGHVFIHVAYDKQGNDISFEVKDTGIGLTQQEIDKIFQPFTQADTSTTRKYGGTGLGLSLSKKLASILGGTISVESAHNVGSNFCLTIPAGEGALPTLVFNLDELTASQAQAAADTARAESVTLSGRVLLTEDNESIQQLILVYLQKMGLTVDVAANGQIALDKLVSDSYDLILMDMQMPVMDGVTAVHELRQRGITTPVIALTANAMREERQQYLATGCNAVVTKPVDFGTLQQAIAEQLKRPLTAQSGSRAQPAGPDQHLVRIVDKYIRSLPEYLDELMQAHASGDFHILQDLIHQLKGSGGQAGFPEITELAGKIELNINNNELDDLRHNLTRLKSVCTGIYADHSGQIAAAGS